MQVSIQYSGSS